MEAVSSLRVLNAAEQAILRVVPDRLKNTVENLLISDYTEEIRFRVNRPVQTIGRRGERLITEHYDFTKKEAESMLEAICNHSVYSMENELCAGYVTLAGGARVGVSGRPIFEKGRITRLTAVSSFNIRIPREVVGCAETSMDMIAQNGYPISAIIASPPGMGKTTFLRDCARCISNGMGVLRPLRVAVADERNELSGSVDGIPELDLGMRTDVMASVPKHISIPMLVRSMAPDVIITDEMAGEQDYLAVSDAAKYGVAVIASVHAGSGSELRAKPYIGAAISEGLFKRALFLRRVGRKINLLAVDS